MINYPDNRVEVEPSVPKGGDFVFPKGKYNFTVTSTTHKTYSTGTEGIEIELEGYYTSGKTFRCFDRVFLTENAMWKFDQFLTGLGITKRPNSDSELLGLVGKRGEAVMAPNDDGYPKVLRYNEIELGESWTRAEDAPLSGEDAPF